MSRYQRALSQNLNKQQCILCDCKQLIFTMTMTSKNAQPSDSYLFNVRYELEDRSKPLTNGAILKK